MVQLPGAHSHVIAIFGNQTYLTALAQRWHSGHAVHSFRGTVTITTGVNVVDSSGELYLEVRNKHTFNIHEAPQRKQRWAKKRWSFVLYSDL